MWATRQRSGMLVNGKDVYDHIAHVARNMTAYFGDSSDFTSFPEQMNAMRPQESFSSHINTILIYDSVIFLHYKEKPTILTPMKKGQKWIPYHRN